jgi:Tol biopolymer transport system component
MRKIRGGMLGVFGMVCLTAGIALADPKIDQQTICPDGSSFGCSVGSKGNHVSVLATKGSRFIVYTDGVAGPKIESLQTSIYGNAFGVGSSWMGQVPILYSDDGSHCAYIAKDGDDFVVYEDGKELSRGPLSGSGANATVPLEFSHNGKHLFYMDQDSTGRYRIVVDGKPGPSSGIACPLVVSPDGEHYCYNGFETTSLGNGIPTWSVVDGQQVNYFGMDMQYTGKNVIVSTMPTPDGNVLFLLNGKPAIKAQQVSPMWISPDGVQIALDITPNNNVPRIFTVNGKEIPDAGGLTVDKVYFSADGKRWAALVATKTGSKFMIIDGKKMEEYQTIPNSITSNDQPHWQFATGNNAVTVAQMEPAVPGFTPDSSKFIYVGQQGAQQFLNVEDNESDGYQQFPAVQPILSSTGNHVGFIGVTPDGKQHLVVDDKDTPYGTSNAQRLQTFTFSPGGTRYACVVGQTLCVDGVTQPAMIDGAHYVFSPDDKHIAYSAHYNNAPAIIVDGKVVYTGAGNIQFICFSPDSQHIYWTTVRRIDGTNDSTMLYLDGKPVLHVSDGGAGSANAIDYEFSSDGVMSFIARTDGNLRLLHITPDSNLAALLAASPAAK